MCGLTGYYLKNTKEKSSETILNMLQIQKHRGPDDSGILGINMAEINFEELSAAKSQFFSNEPDLVLGFNRLSILDLSPAGHQPMINEMAKVVLMMNGEVYNVFDFKPDLKGKATQRWY
jgi:asparagine synthase (glutamine-hydrolysing)